ncbi:MAG: hypothetical protein NZ828_02215 [Alphaproteobacteria bacterium]|nr:hypothetical protein [Alphaproteobacteria bacterium]MCS5596048.1 hypothetical protein [Alphaproteobacteria bacterium]|tara:strand:+ start:3313 stop:3531 length:219 start_codon:yes stop_codon:yes gene_type:complete
MAKKHIKSATRGGVGPMKPEMQRDFNDVQGARLEHALQLARGEKVTGLNPAKVRELTYSISLKQLSELKQTL